ncbi:putative HSP20-like chaperone [Helianthus annuus]|nr:putative HSP20-like chaperone [Helianthus annuus]KAJ0764700.1 putative HSP20-like chaperone [Helianthus annuus]
MLRLARLSSRYYAGGASNIRSYAAAAAAAAKEKSTLMSSISLFMDNGYLSLNMPAVEKRESDDGNTTCVVLNIPGLEREDFATATTRVEDDYLLLQVRKYEPRLLFYNAFVVLPPDSSSTIISTEMQDGLLKVTLPKLKHYKPSILQRFYWILDQRLLASLPNVAMSCFGRPFMVYKYCSRYSDSFTIYKKATAGSLHMRITPGIHNMDCDVPGGGVCVSLNMPDVKIEDVKSFFRHDTLFIQGKTKTAYYATGIRLLEGNSLGGIIKTEMQDGIYKATIGFVGYQLPLWRRLAIKLCHRLSSRFSSSCN